MSSLVILLYGLIAIVAVAIDTLRTYARIFEERKELMTTHHWYGEMDYNLTLLEKRARSAWFYSFLRGMLWPIMLIGGLSER